MNENQYASSMKKHRNFMNPFDILSEPGMLPPTHDSNVEQPAEMIKVRSTNSNLSKNKSNSRVIEYQVKSPSTGMINKTPS